MGRLAERLAPDLFTAPQASEWPDGVPQEVCILFEKLALEVHEKGYKRFSSDAILHRIRWTYRIERGNREFLCNDHWTAPLARWFLARHPDMPKFFELRASPGGDR